MKTTRLILLFFLLNSCIGGGIGPDYYIKAKFDGKERVFKSLVTGQKGLENDKIVHLVMGASESDGNSFPAYDLEIWNLNDEIKAGGQYRENEINLISRYATDGFTKYNNVNNSVQDFQIKIERLETGRVSGTFSGTITNSNGQDLVISEGEFNCPIKD